MRLREKVAARLGVDPHDLKPGDIKRPLQLFGQEILPITYAMGRMNAIVHDMQAEIVLGDTMKVPRFLSPRSRGEPEGGGGLRTFDKVAANPMWNQKFATEVYENDPYNRFTRGTPPANAEEVANIAKEIGAEVLRGPLRYPSETGGWQLDGRGDTERRERIGDKQTVPLTSEN